MKQTQQKYATELFVVNAQLSALKYNNTTVNALNNSKNVTFI